MKTLATLAAGLLLVAGTCTEPLLSGDPDADREHIAQLEQEARSLANPEGCSGDAECRSAPVGVKACGGPRDHVIYCPRATDEPRLLQVLAALEETERAYLTRYGGVSDCAYVTAPELECVGGICRATGRPASSE